MEALTRLFEPFCIGRLGLKNRIVMPAMATNFADEAGKVTDQLVSYYEARARGGAGLIIVEVTCVDFPRGNTIRNQLGVHADSCVDGLGRLADAVKRHGAKIALQLHHAGRRASAMNTGMAPVAPSAIPCYGGDKPVELDEEGIRHILRCFGRAAGRAKEAGFDAVEIHCAHGYIIHQFLSPLTNRRLDSYGGSLENRLRFLEEIVKAVRGNVGEAYPVMARISADEFLPGGMRVEDSAEVARRLENWGICCIHVSAGSTPSTAGEYDAQKMTSIPSLYSQNACFIEMAREIGRAVQLPVIGVGRINDPLVAESILEEKKVDLVAMGRAFIADPDFPRKSLAGDFKSIRKCIGCLYCIDTVLGKRKALACAVNPLVGMEGNPPGKSAVSKKVIVIGGGPAGMEAAAWAGARGHHVRLWEKAERLGGQLLLAMIPPHKAELKSIVDFQSANLGEHAVQMETGREATPESIREAQADIVILAAGAVPKMPEELAGIGKVLTAAEVLTDVDKAGGNIIVLGGGLVGCEVAGFLAGHNRKVLIIEAMQEIAKGVSPLLRKSLLSTLDNSRISIRCGVERFEVIDGKMLIESGEPGTEVLEFDTIVPCTGYVSDRELAETMTSNGLQCFPIGDCLKPRGIAEAIHEGFQIGIRV